MASDNQPMRELILSSRCILNSRFIDSNTREVLYSTRTPKGRFSRDSVTTITRHTPSTNQPCGSKSDPPPIPQSASPNLPEKVAPPPNYTPESKQEPTDGGNEIEITKIRWKFFDDTLFEHDSRTENVNQIIKKSGLRPLRFNRTFDVNGVSYKWDLGLVGFDTPTLKLNDRTEAVVAKFHRAYPFTRAKPTLELRQGFEDILDTIVMTLVWAEWRQMLGMSIVIPIMILFL
ncbi:hypothetical protein BDM02DRAFT_1265348 [Thelephora ganbajun]|uniref:Uncharacterized protein n=1 Tax=Thelephora ganbajun TaxID=370292 RepID=A0ACB6Z338_THEGA|nr:hypothetical protein BDM02DRAFT_1265348 [Thelephora ganbajun]